MAIDDWTWRDDALCKDSELDWMITDTNSAREERKAICARCPVMTACRAYAILTEQEYGIWGGLSPGERRTIRNLRRSRA